MNTPHLSVIIAVYNGEPYLAEAIQSVLDQDYHDYELIVVDDGSTDRSAEIAQRFDRVRLIRQDNGGNAAAHNAGVSAALGHLIAFLDADDLWVAGTLAGRVAMFDEDPALEIAHGMVEEFVSEDLTARISPAGRSIGKAIPSRLCGVTIVRRETFDRVGLLDPNLKLGSWMDWLLRVEEVQAKTRAYDTLVLRRRIHGGNLSIRESKSQYVRTLKRALDRRRRKID